MKNKNEPASTGQVSVGINKETMIMNIKTFDNLINRNTNKRNNSSIYDEEIAHLTKLPTQKSIIYNKNTHSQYKMLAPTPKVNQMMLLRSS
jgi:hypothetical protein